MSALSPFKPFNKQLQDQALQFLSGKENAGGVASPKKKRPRSLSGSSPAHTSKRARGDSASETETTERENLIYTTVQNLQLKYQPKPSEYYKDKFLKKYVILISKGTSNPSLHLEAINRIRSEVALFSDYFKISAKQFAFNPATEMQIKELLQEAQGIPAPEKEDSLSETEKWNREVELLFSQNKFSVEPFGERVKKLKQQEEEAKLEREIEAYEREQMTMAQAALEKEAEDYLQREKACMPSLPEELDVFTPSFFAPTQPFFEDDDDRLIELAEQHAAVELFPDEMEDDEPFQSRAETFLREYILMISKGMVDPAHFQELIQQIAQKDVDLAIDYKKYALPFSRFPASEEAVRDLLTKLLVEELDEAKLAMEATLGFMRHQYLAGR